MHVHQDNERRKSQRTPLTTFCPVSFVYGGTNWSAVMVNLSSNGAGFRLDQQAAAPEFVPGEEIVFTVRTPYGNSECTGKFAWGSTNEEHFRWGVQFTELADDPRDPLRCFMDSSF